MVRVLRMKQKTWASLTCNSSCTCLSMPQLE
jgi:hypothetical protein